MEWLLKRIADLMARKYTGRITLHFHLGQISSVEKLDKDFSTAFKKSRQK